jgi:transposase InsO family protein
LHQVPVTCTHSLDKYEKGATGVLIRRGARMSRPPSPVVAPRHEGLLQRIGALKAESPCWGGYRRIWAYLRCIEQPAVRGDQEVMRSHQPPHPLLIHGRLQAKRTPTRRTPKPTKPDEWWGIDMTKVLVEGFGWVYIVVVREWYTEKIVGYEVGLRSTTPQWLAALDRAVNRQFPAGARGQGLSPMSDHGCQPTSMAFMQACNILGIHQIVTRDNNPKGHADTERVIRTLKAESLWLHAWTSLFPFASALERWTDDYNEHYLHSALGYKPPRQFERDYHLSHGTQLPAA